MSYHITGSVSAFIFLLTIGGLWAQLSLVWQRRRQADRAGNANEKPTAVLSVNQFVSSFLAFFSFYLYGACLERFNHYLVWPRLAAAILTLAVLFEIVRDRRDPLSFVSLVGCSFLLIAASFALLFVPGAAEWGRTFSGSLIVVVTAILAQGYLHQVVVIRRTGTTGGVSAKLHQFFLWKDIATMAFAATMGFASGWPVMLMSVVSGLTKVITLWHFRWVRLSPVARERREALRQSMDTNLHPIA